MSAFAENKNGGADSSIDLLNQADNLLHQAGATKGNAAGDAERTQLLIQARALIRQVPRDKALFQGHKRKAFLEIKAALHVINGGNPDDKTVTDHIRNADTELRTAISLGRGASAAPQ